MASKRMLKDAFEAGARIQSWHLNEGATNSNDGRWDDLPRDREPVLACEEHLYRVRPEDLFRLEYKMVLGDAS